MASRATNFLTTPTPTPVCVAASSALTKLFMLPKKNMKCRFLRVTVFEGMSTIESVTMTQVKLCTDVSSGVAMGGLGPPKKCMQLTILTH